MPQLDVVNESFVVHTPKVTHPNRKATIVLISSLEVNQEVQHNLPANPKVDLPANPEVDLPPK